MGRAASPLDAPNMTGKGRWRVASTSGASAVLSGNSATKMNPKTVAKSVHPGVLVRHDCEIQIDHRRADSEGDDRDVTEHAPDIGRLPLLRYDGVESVIASTHRREGINSGGPTDH